MKLLDNLNKAIVIIIVKWKFLKKTKKIDLSLNSMNI